MSPEKSSGLNGEQEVLAPSDRFDKLLDRMMPYASGTDGWLELPVIRVSCNNKNLPTQFFLFNPKSLQGYDSTRYEPSIIMERGQKALEEETGRILHDSERYWVRRSPLESLDLHDEKMIQAMLNLVKIENHFEEYKKIIDALKKTEQS